MRVELAVEIARHKMQANLLRSDEQTLVGAIRKSVRCQNRTFKGGKARAKKS
jgi:hypothetical protein